VMSTDLPASRSISCPFLIFVVCLRHIQRRREVFSSYLEVRFDIRSPESLATPKTTNAKYD
jgi:hypothetical protein